MDTGISLGNLVPLHMATQECLPNHVHCYIGVISETSPMPDQSAWVNDETGEFFYPFEEFVQCLN